MAKARGLLFIRWGGLSSVVQEGYNAKMPTYHCPPARRGIYAFPYPYIEHFLLGAMKFMPHRMEWVKDKEGNRIGSGFPYGTGHPDYSLLSEKYMGFREAINPEAPEDDQDYVWYLAKHVTPRKFNYGGDIWHHLETVDRKDRLVEKGSWIKTDINVYKAALKRDEGLRSFEAKRNGYGSSRDHLEVFIEKV